MRGGIDVCDCGELSMAVHSTAIISKKAKIGLRVEVGPYSVIGDNVAIGDNCKIHSHVVIDGNTSIGGDCQIFKGASLGGIPQDLKYKGEKAFLEIGDGNIIREFCTFNTGSTEGSKTVIGQGNLFMAYCHVGHDSLVGNNCVIANSAAIAGHVVIEDRAVVGGIVAIHQFVRVGKLSIIGGCSKVVQDIPPYSTCDGHPAEVYGLNLVGLRRQNISRESIKALDHAFRILFNKGLSMKHALEELSKETNVTAEITDVIDFIKKTERGISRSCRGKSN
ncbi:MAG: acyl-ACP--UDP-N-acetylglucosamine O-acyltransferase [Candidatus Omnitrophota bacterium]